MILATGVTARDPKIPGQDGPNVLSYIDVLLHGKPVGERVAIVGAGGIGFDVAEFLVTPAGPFADAEPRGVAGRSGAWPIRPRCAAASSARSRRRRRAR